MVSSPGRSDVPSPATIAHGAAACLQALAAACAPAPAQQTLDHLRADLSHEMAAKHARLAALLREWRAGRRRERDNDDAAGICRDIARLYLRHARTAAGSWRGFAGLVRVLARVRVLASAMGKAAGGNEPALERAERDLPRLMTAARALVEVLSARHAVRFGELVTAAVDEVRRETQAAEAEAVPVILDSADGGAPLWVPRADMARWSDLLRNLVRNAAQATGELTGPTRPAVTVRLRPLPPPGGVLFEVQDGGVGMTAEQLTSIWQDGVSRHGAGHGLGLTAAKRAFVAERAAVHAASESGVGTRIRLDLPMRDLAFRVPRWWAAPPLVVPAALCLLLATGAALHFRHGEMNAVRVIDEHVVAAFDRRGHTLWQRRFADRVRSNLRSQIQTERAWRPVEVPLLLVNDSRGRPLVIVVTVPDQGPGRVFALDGSGRERWSRRLAWTPPRVTHAGNLTAVFQAATTWNGSGREVIALNVRDGNWSSTSILFLSPDGDSLGAYLHPGHLEFLASGDIDGDGRSELVLNGKNNDAPRDAGFWPGPTPPDDAYGECLVLLETPEVDGQAFPARRWDGPPGAREDAYLLVPPLTAAGFADPKGSAIVRIELGATGAPGSPRHEISLADGRIYTLDDRLRPLSCTVGDHTPASGMSCDRAAAPLLYFRDGHAESIDVPIERGKP